MTCFCAGFGPHLSARHLHPYALCVYLVIDGIILCKRSIESVKPTLKELMRELRGKTADWEDVGVELEVDDGMLKRIKMDNPGDSKSCLRELFRKWLSRVDPQPKWADIVEAVEGIGDEELASKIKAKHCP